MIVVVDRLTTRQATSVAKQKPQAADGTQISLGQLRISIGKAVLESRSSAGRAAPVTHANNTNSADLLGLSTPPAPSNTGVLVDVLGDIYSSATPTAAPSATQNNYNPKKFVCKNNGVLFENDLIQIGVKCEFRQNLGRLGLFYGNKTKFPLQNLSANLQNPGEWVNKLNIQVRPVEPVLEAGAQIQQMVNAECIEDYIDSPSMVVTFLYNNVPQKLTMKLPLTLNKFFEPTEMNGESFFARWKNLGGGFSVNKQCIVENLKEESLVALRKVCDGISAAGGLKAMEITNELVHAAKNSHAHYSEHLAKQREEMKDKINSEKERKNPQKSQKIFRATGPMDLTATRTKVLGFGMQLLENIDPNPDNFVCAGIIHTRTQQIGCLLRLEPNKQAQYLMGLYDSECLTHGTRQWSGGHCPGFSETITDAYFPKSSAYFPKSSPTLPPRLAPQTRSYLAPPACACVVRCPVPRTLDMFQNIDGCSEVDGNDITLWLGADNNGGYKPLTDEEVIASFLSDANESDAEEADGDIEDPVMSHGDAVTKLNELMVYFEWQAETSPAELLMLKRLRDRTARKRQTTLDWNQERAPP
ncbi:AP-2 complex subunit alpha-2 [Homalodisca vitripennis]|nr:AP-2 complex subunit alpha-2 [Homalodisca vitripennis]